MDDVLARVQPQLGAWMGKQRWVAKSPEALASVKVLDSAVLDESGLVWALVRLGDGAVYQVLLAAVDEDTAASLREKRPESVIEFGEDNGESGAVIDALSDEDQVLRVIRSLGWSEVRGERARILGAEQSNTSVVLDETIIVKFFRRLYVGVNPDVEVTKVLSAASFAYIAPAVEMWRRGNWDLAIAQQFLIDGEEGWTAFLEHGRRALSTLHDWCSVPLYAASTATPSAGGAVAECGSGAVDGREAVPGAREARALGEMTAALHLAMAKAFGSSPLDVSRLRISLESSMASLGDPPALQGIVNELAVLGDSGDAVRVHGDFHLGQTMCVAEGWRTFDFEGEPARPLEERTVPASPYKDVAGMVRSFGYAAATVLREHPVEEWFSVPHKAALSASLRYEKECVSATATANALAGMADGGDSDSGVSGSEGSAGSDGATACTLEEGARCWEALICEEYLAGYHASPEIDSILPEGAAARKLLLDASIAEKAIYELAYEKTYRPDWVAIPEAALQRLFG